MVTSHELSNNSYPDRLEPRTWDETDASYGRNIRTLVDDVINRFPSPSALPHHPPCRNYVFVGDIGNTELMLKSQKFGGCSFIDLIKNFKSQTFLITNRCAKAIANVLR